MRAPTLLLAGLVLGWSGTAHAQSSASFPDLPSTARPAPQTPAARPPAFESPAEPRMARSELRSEPSLGAAGGGMPSYSPPASVPAPAFGQPAAGWTGSFSLGEPAPRAPSADQGSTLVMEEGPATTPLVIGGVAFGLPYATGVGIAASESFDNGSGWLVAPVAGPWLALSSRRDPCAGAADKKELDSDVGKCVAEPMVRGMLVLDGVLQAAGAVLLVVGASSSETRIVRREVPVVATPAPVGSSGYGLAMAGRF